MCHTLLNKYRPDYGTLTTMCFRPRYRWDETTPLNKRPHSKREAAAVSEAARLKKLAEKARYLVITP